MPYGELNYKIVPAFRRVCRPPRSQQKNISCKKIASCMTMAHSGTGGAAPDKARPALSVWPFSPPKGVGFASSHCGLAAIIDSP